MKHHGSSEAAFRGGHRAQVRRADELAAQGKTGEIAGELEVSPATLYNWRRSYGGMDTDAAKELK
jgi:putative transposase